MKLSIFIAFIVLAFLAYAAQGQRCPGSARAPICRGRKDEGHGGRGCQAREMWYHVRNRRCEKMNYKGCGGNRNRFCTKAECERRC